MEMSTKSEKPKELKLNHYTTYDALLKILDSGLRFSDPEGWEDKNDAELMKMYKDYAKLKTLLAVCFSCSSETIHHWENFASKKNKIGCCIEFKKKELLEKVEGNDKYRHNKVNYILIERMNSNNLKIEDLPFTKRYPYQIEKEYRIIYQSQEYKNKKDRENIAIRDIANCIKKITLSGMIDKELFELIKERLKKEFEILKLEKNIEINQSTIYENKEWIDGAKRLIKQFSLNSNPKE